MVHLDLVVVVAAVAAPLMAAAIGPLVSAAAAPPFVALTPAFPSLLPPS